MTKLTLTAALFHYTLSMSLLRRCHGGGASSQLVMNSQLIKAFRSPLEITVFSQVETVIIE